MSDQNLDQDRDPNVNAAGDRFVWRNSIEMLDDLWATRKERDELRKLVTDLRSENAGLRRALDSLAVERDRLFVKSIADV